MNAVDRAETHIAYLGLGSNIEPETNLVGAVQALRAQLPILCKSSVWKSPSLGAPGPDFLNAAIKVETSLDSDALRQTLLRPIERWLGRVRSPDKYAPRTIDLDVLIFDSQILDEHIWDYPHLAVPLAECAPGLEAPTGRPLAEIANEFRLNGDIHPVALVL